MEAEKKGKGWVVLIGLFLMYSCASGVMTNSIGVIFAAIIEDLKFKPTELSVYYTIRGIASAIEMPFLMKMVTGKRTRGWMIVSALLSTAAFGFMGFFQHLWQWYAVGIFSSVSLYTLILAIPIYVSGWFDKRIGTLTGAVFAASGIAGAIFNPLFSVLISRHGWRAACFAIGLLGIAALVMPAVFMVKKPEMRADTAEEKTETKKEVFTRKPHIFVLCCVVILFPYILTAFNNQIPTFARSIGHTLETGAFMVSCAMIGNLIGKVVFGMIADRAGIFSAIALFLAFLCIGFGLLIPGEQIPVLLYAGAFLYGMIYGITMTAPAILFGKVFGRDGYAGKFSIMKSLCSLSTAFSGTLIPAVYDLTHSFRPVLFFGMAACAAAMIALFLVQNEIMHTGKGRHRPFYGRMRHVHRHA